ncbi:hypothetical protein FLBR109950_03850 [Flavobacterium branchiophilum]|uniref:hypothetical protein n=1 Tax=Flavobacterium branchiophilum TaxID=55197 RepID=UPI0002DEA281|nr:hypothetical protein [Flavobacterium branchiophilum]
MWARYYDPRISIWASVDPYQFDGTYWNGDHNGGFYNQFNFNTYGYCYQNPVRLIDPNGKQTDVVNRNVIFSVDKDVQIDKSLRGRERLDAISHVRVNQNIINSAKNQKLETGTFHVYGHGWDGYFAVFDYPGTRSGSYTGVYNSENLKSWFSKYKFDSSILDKENNILIFHSCKSGEEQIGIALKISKEKQNIITVGVSGPVLYSKNGEIGTASNGRK